MITRRCSRREFLLRPGAATNQAFLYCLGEAAARFDIELHWVEAMSNHHHLGCFDEHGHYPAFIAHLHKMIAKVMNAHWGRWENFWSDEQTSVVRLVEPHDAFDKMIYTLTNPVKDHLVAQARHWPGASSLNAQLNDKTITVRRPHWFFAKNGRMPEEVTLRFTRPRGYEHLSHEAWVEMVSDAVAKVEAKAAATREATGTRVVGRRRVLRQSAFDSPNTHAPRRRMKPRVAAKNKWRRIEVLLRDKKWRIAYAAALSAHRAGAPAVMFPAGTYKLRVERHVTCLPFAA